jgi:arylsulfatase A-like enzyme
MEWSRLKILWMKLKRKRNPFLSGMLLFFRIRLIIPPDSLLQKYIEDAPSEPVAKYWAMIDWFDITVGQLLDSIDQRGLTDNTLVIYLADNGWIQNPDELNRFSWPSKQSPYDMGIRTHMTYKWPGQIPAEYGYDNLRQYQ